MDKANEDLVCRLGHHSVFGAKSAENGQLRQARFCVKRRKWCPSLQVRSFSAELRFLPQKACEFHPLNSSPLVTACHHSLFRCKSAQNRLSDSEPVLGGGPRKTLRRSSGTGPARWACRVGCLSLQIRRFSVESGRRRPGRKVRKSAPVPERTRSQDALNSASKRTPAQPDGRNGGRLRPPAGHPGQDAARVHTTTLGNFLVRSNSQSSVALASFTVGDLLEPDRLRLQHRAHTLTLGRRYSFGCRLRTASNLVMYVSAANYVGVTGGRSVHKTQEEGQSQGRERPQQPLTEVP